MGSKLRHTVTTWFQEVCALVYGGGAFGSLWSVQLEKPPPEAAQYALPVVEQKTGTFELLTPSHCMPYGLFRIALLAARGSPMRPLATPADRFAPPQ